MFSCLFGFAIVCFAIMIAFIYQVLICPYLQYRYYQEQARQNPNLLIDISRRFIPLFGDLIRLNNAIKQSEDPFFLLREAIKNRARFNVAFIGCIPRIAILDADVLPELLSAKMFDQTGISQISAMVFGLMVPNSLIAMEGIRWQQRRKIVVPTFRYQMMKIYADAISKMAQELLDDIEESRTEIDFVKMFKHWTISIIGTCAFGGAFTNFDESDRKLAEEAVKSLTTMITLSADFTVSPLNLIPGMLWFPTPARIRFRSAIRRCRSIANEVIRRRLQGQKPAIECERDLLDVLLSYSTESGHPLSAEDIRDECLLFIFAGHETTANLLSWLFVIFYQHPEIQQQCRQEVLDVLRSSESKFPTEANIKAMPYLHSCLLETLRLYPPAPAFGRQTHRRCNLGGLKVQSGTLLRIDIWAIHHSPRYWKDPFLFNPNRFLSQDENGNVFVRHPTDVHTHAFIPFGHGIRNCPGQGFALLEARIVMAGLLSKFDVEFSSGQKFPEKVAITSCPKYGIMGRLIHRKESTDLSSPTLKVK